MQVNHNYTSISNTQPTVDAAKEHHTIHTLMPLKQPMINNSKMVEHNQTKVTTTGEFLDKQQQGQTLEEQESVSQKQAEESIEYINKRMKILNSSLEFTLHEDTNRMIVNVIERDSDELIRQIPPEQMLDLLAKIWSMSGIFVDEAI